MNKSVTGTFIIILLVVLSLLAGMSETHRIFAAEGQTGIELQETTAAKKSDEAIISKEQTIETLTGEKDLIVTSGKILDISVTRPEVADAFIHKPQEMIVVAHGPGIGKIVVNLDTGDTIAYKVRVSVADPQKFVDKLKKEIGHIQGINIEVVKGKILVDGRVLYLKDMDEIERAIGDNPSVINLTSLSSRNARILAREIERELRESGIYGARVEVRENRVTLVGTLRSELLVKKSEHIASTYTPDFDSLLKVGPEQTPATQPTEETEDESQRNDE